MYLCSREETHVIELSTGRQVARYDTLIRNFIRELYEISHIWTPYTVLDRNVTGSSGSLRIA